MEYQTGWETAKNILVIRLDSLGDILMTTPAIRALKQSLPGRRITLLTSENGAKVANFIPEIDDVIIYNAPWMKATTTLVDNRHEYLMAAHLQQAGFDAAVIFTVFSQSSLPAAFLCHLADIPLTLAHCRENPYQLLSDWVKDPEPEQLIRHEVRRQLDLVKHIGCETEDEHLSFSIPGGDAHRFSRLLDRIGLDLAKPWVIIHAGASAASRRYPPEHFAQAADLLAGKYDVQVVFTGSKEERTLVRSIRTKMKHPSFNLCGQLDLGAMGAVIQAAPVLISNNTGPVHIASAVGTPVVDLYALTNPQHPPWMVASRVLYHDVPCKYCYKSICPEKHHNCLRQVEPESVVRATLELLEEETRYHFDDLPEVQAGNDAIEFLPGMIGLNQTISIESEIGQ